jgi:threonine/homoserine/homoserine lactone efflux protein
MMDGHSIVIVLAIVELVLFFVIAIFWIYSRRRPEIAEKVRIARVWFSWSAIALMAYIAYRITFVYGG